MNKLIFTISLILISHLLVGQVESNLHHKNISTQTDTVILDSLSIDPGSVVMDLVDTMDYEVLYAQGLLVWYTAPKTDSVSITYRTWPINISDPVTHKEMSVFRPNASGKVNPFTYQGNNPEQVKFSTGKLDKTGSISRGMLFGNNQNLGVNSNLNLQLSGELTDNIKIKAVISDNNIPVQPDGNTQLLQDFDQVYIQLYNDSWKLVAGDFRIQNPKSHFMTFDKRLRGGGISTKFDMNDHIQNELSVNAAVSRGKFARNIIQGVEGNQGPYRLKGSENEAYIIVLSGTEVVYIDGKKLIRGQENDYVIDYNKAEVVFTAKQPIHKDKRIVVEFQYSAQAYSRSLIQVSDHIKTEKLNLTLNVYSEQDSKNQPLLQDLTDANKLLLESIGNDIDQAIVSSAREVEFSNDRVLYQLLMDSLSGDSVYVYSTDPELARYQLSFSDVGLGNGDYTEISSSANGRVFEYVAPVNGLKQGNYLPVILLITPKKTQMFTLGGDYALNKNTKILFEGVYTQNDQNTFSERDQAQNQGGGFVVGFENRRVISKDSISPWVMKTQVSYENRTDNFEEIQRYRSVEFDRNWNVRGQNLTGMQHVPTAQIGFLKNNLGEMGYQFKSFVAGDSYQGIRHQLLGDLDNEQFSAKLNASLLSSKGELGVSDFNRHKILLQKKYKGINLGVRDDFEHNLKRENAGDSLSNSSYSFWEWEAFVTNGDEAKNKYKLAYISRVNDKVLDQQLSRATDAKSILGNVALLSNPKVQVQLTSQYRVLEVKNDQLFAGKPEQNLTNRIDYSLRLLKGALSWSSFYEIGSGLTEEQAYIYLEVPAGTGVYTWIDYNGNGIAEQDEFEIAKFQDQANYIRVLTQTNNFEKIYRTQFNQSIFLRPAVVWKNKDGIRKLLSKFSNQLAYRIDRKTDNNEVDTWVNPFATNIADSNIRMLNSSLRNTVYLNRASKLWSIDYTYQELGAKILQTNGLLGTGDAFHQLNFRYNMSRVYQINLEGTSGSKQSGAEFSSERNYNINYQSFKPTLTYLQGSGVNIKLYFEQSEKTNLDELGGERNLSKKFGSEVTVRKVGKGSMTLSGSYLINDFVGDINSPVSFQMLEGLQVGQNALWEVNYQRTIAQNLQLNLRYNGRVSEDNPVIHTGGIQVRAFF